MIEISNIIGVILAVPVALLVEGFRRKIYARMQGRKGAVIMQPFYDVAKLLTKKSETKNKILGLMPLLSLIISLSLFLFIPFNVISFDFDFILLAYLFILSDAFYLVGALTQNSQFASHSCVKDLVFMVNYAIIFFISITCLVTNGGATNLTNFNANLMILKMPVMSLILLYSGMMIVKISPYDAVASDPEISEGMFSEYYGKNLALVYIGDAVKDLAFYILAALLIFGPANWIAGSIALIFIYTISKAAIPKYSMLYSMKILLFITLISFIDLVLLI